MMLRLTAETAIHWMQIGLPLKMINIVIYTTNFIGINRDPMLHCFKNLKSKWITEWEEKENKVSVCC